MRPQDLSLFTLCVQTFQFSLGAYTRLSKFGRSIGSSEQRSISVLEIAIKRLSECERSIGVLRTAMKWLSDCESGGLSNVSRQAALHLCLLTQYQPPDQSEHRAFMSSLVSTFIL